MNQPIDPYTIEPERYEMFAELLRGNRRRFFQTVGAGLVVVMAAPDVLAQRPRGRRGGFGGFRQGPREISAWLHIGADGTVTVYTGKVELGQNIRTSLTQVVAEELGALPAQVRMAMADTDLTPFDMGTFGSMTTPTMAPQLRRAAAAAREQLLDLAADRLKAQRAGLAVAGGHVRDTATGRSIGFGELTGGKKLVRVINDDAPTTPPAQWRVEGQSLPKVNGRALVTGEHRYASDVRRPGLLHGKVVWPPAFHAQLVSADTSAAKKLPGVTVVHQGDFLAVAAPTQLEAERAAAAIKTEWKTTAQPSSDELFDDLKKHARQGGGGFGGFGRGGGPRGSVKTGLASADHKLEASYTVAYIAHFPLETRSAVAEWQGDRLTVWAGTQRPFGVRSELAQALSLPEKQVHVIVPDTGSGYGGKHTGEAAVEAARLSKAAGKPVRVAWTREEEMTWAYFRPAGVIDIRAGIRKDGKLTAWECNNYNSGGSALDTPYDAANVSTAFHSTESPLRQGSYRALAATANHFARESHMDDLAHLAGIDPLAFRLKNLKNDRLRGVLEAAAERFGWGKTKPPAGHGYGIAGGTEKGSYVATCAEVAVDRGRVKVVRVVTAFDCGAVLNPEHLKNQVEGAVVMGLGGALFEAIKFANGKILNARLSKYRVPRFRDLPLLETVLVDRKDIPSAGAGETPIVAIAPAVGNAIFAATGKRLRSMPMVPDGLKG